jgi:hypothetical protein
MVPDYETFAAVLVAADAEFRGLVLAEGVHDKRR